MHQWYPLILGLGFTTLSVLFKLLSRRDRDDAPFRNDLYIGQDLLLATLSVLAIYLIKAIVTGNSKAGLDCALFAPGCLLLLVILGFLDRYYAWENAGLTFRRRWGRGVILPNMLGVAVYVSIFLFGMSRELL